ncbi:hypothetical protein FRB90_000268 [Tulasnella sp. 427]|nr:hypothetical protein FRB90_000268 [Tulasnella sp. 427]
MLSSSTCSTSGALNPIKEDSVPGEGAATPQLCPSGTNVNQNGMMTHHTHSASSSPSSSPPAVHFALPPHHPPSVNNSPFHLPTPPSSLLLPPPPPPSLDDLHAALTASLPSSASSSLPSTPAPSEMLFFDTSPDHVEIVIPGDSVVLRGVGQDVEPTIFAGQVVLRLPEATNIKEINLNFTGKSKLPSADARAPAFRQPITTQTFFSHDWSLLQGAKGHRHTLKAGTHSFPFQLNIDDTFPSSVSIGTSSIAYKLRVTVVRSSFSSNWVAQRPVTILRGFSPEALEFNQTLEIENTWPGKIMYSVMIPHKAFAAGDDIPVSLKFTPLVKGVAVMSIETAVKQYVTVRAKGGLPFQDSRIVAKTTHFVRDGQPVEARQGRRTSPTLWDVSSAYVRTTAVMTPSVQVEPDHIPPRDPSSSTGSRSGASSGRGSSEDAVEDQDDPERGDNELDTCLKFRIPAWTTPSNMSEPITINYKLKWSMTLSNLDGHTSELRCALPLHILSHALLDEARAASLQTRAILFGGEDVEPTQTLLPSYASHIQDRIANALDGVAPTRLAPNPLHNLHQGGGGSGGGSGSTPGTPGEEVVEPARGELGLVDTGLLLSLGESGAAFLRNNPSAVVASRNNSTETTPSSSFRGRAVAAAMGGSRPSSRATSPEPPEPVSELPSAGNKSIFSLKPFTKVAYKLASANSKSMSQIHGSHHPASISGSSSSGGGSSTTPSSPNLLSRALGTRSRPASSSNLFADFASHASSTASSSSHPNQMEMLSDLLSRVPNYERASQGFLGGGVPPLDTYAGLPTYNEVESELVRARSDEALMVERAEDDLALRRNATPRPVMLPRSVTSSSEPRRRQASFTLDP